MGHGHRFRRGVAGALGAVVVAGCSASGGSPADPTQTPDATPSMSASQSPSASPAPSPSPSGPAIPAAARQQTDAGAEAFVKYFFEQFNVAWTEPRPGLIASLSDPDCQFCAKVEATASTMADDGHRHLKNPTSLKSVQLFGGAPSGEQFAEIELVQNDADIVDGAGRVVRSDSRREDNFYVTLRWARGRWAMLEMERTE